MGLINWSYYKAWAELPDDGLKAVIEPIIEAASAAIIRYCRRPFTSTAVTGETYDGDGTPVLWLRQTPVLAVSAVRIAGETVDAGAYVWKSNGRLVLLDTTHNIRLVWTGTFPKGTQNVAVDYSAGYAAVPASIQLACAELTAYWYNRGRQVGIAAKSAKAGSQQYTAEEDMPFIVRMKLNPYFRVGPGVV